MRAAVAGPEQQDDRRDGVIEGDRPHLRESALTREAETHVRAFVLATFPVLIALLWPTVDAAERPLFLAAIAWIALANAAGYLVPWHRFPRWLELSAPLSTIPALVLFAAPAGGLVDGYGVVVMIPALWLALYADPPDIALGLALVGGSLLLPIERWFDALPAQGSPRQVAFFMVLLVVVALGVHPAVRPLRHQIRRTRRAVDALHASQATLAHDLRNPITAIRALSLLTQQRLEHGTDPAGDRHKLMEHARQIGTAAERAERVIEGVLELSQAGEQLPHVEAIDLPALVNEVSMGIPDVLVRTSGAPRTIVGHRPSISRLVANLLDNAALHGRDDGEQVTVTIAGRELPGGWQLTIADDGRGFEPDEIDALFQPWRRGSHADASGSGLGLAIVAGIVGQHGGSITAANSDDGGAVLTLTLSRRPSVARDQPCDPTASPPLPAGASS